VSPLTCVPVKARAPKDGWWERRLVFFSCLVPPPLLVVVGGVGVRLPRSLRIELEAASFFLPRQEQSSMRMNRRTTELS